MKHNCDIVRDLMPLCIDDTASQESRKMVLEHASECGACQKMFEEMKQALPESSIPDEMRPEVKLIARARRIRLWKRIITIALTCTLLVIGGWTLMDNMRNVWTYAVDPADYDLVFSRRTNGDVIVTTKRLNNRTMSSFTQFDSSDGVRVYGMQSHWLSYAVKEERSVSSERDESLIWIEGEGLFVDTHYDAGVSSERTRVNEIWSNGEMLYQHGDEIPLASEELEAYMQVYDQLYGTRDSYWARWQAYYDERASAEDQLAASRSLHEQLKALEKGIPEWEK